MEKIAFRMTLKPGHLDEYRKRHDEIWPDLVEALKAAGIRDYSIHYDAATNALFATLWREEGHTMDALPSLEVMQRWWTSMAPLMETNPDGSPVSVPLETVFHLA
ncbi:L-rhamnose mutarotase [Novosphingobium rosa]|uniref:L-rhamnose mutarotase n=1 Tax=Novosphingobium rosa TaxID=76978 RepID=UPI00082A673D|nr:L-rhamnose mutarotase [Novosphingobium rosa]